MPSSEAVLELQDISMEFRLRSGLGSRGPVVRAVDGLSLTVGASESVALVGESGCGKSTTGRIAMGLIRPTAGRVEICGLDPATAQRAELKKIRRAAQMVFQDPSTSLDPRMSIEQSLLEPLRMNSALSRHERLQRVGAALELVGLAPRDARRRPAAFSGGQRQRIGIARALISEPALIVLDEPTSALDVSIQAQILNLLSSIQREKRVAFLFISHDLSVVRHVSDRVAVMHKGKIVETGPTVGVFEAPQHEYTRTLLSSVPIDHPRDRQNRRLHIAAETQATRARDGNDERAPHLSAALEEGSTRAHN